MNEITLNFEKPKCPFCHSELTLKTFLNISIVTLSCNLTPCEILNKFTLYYNIIGTEVNSVHLGYDISVKKLNNWLKLSGYDYSLYGFKKSKTTIHKLSFVDILHKPIQNPKEELLLSIEEYFPLPKENIINYCHELIDRLMKLKAFI